MASNQQTIQQYLTTGTYNITVPPGFSSNVVVYAWGGGGGSGHVRGGAGGFVKSIVNVTDEDSFVLSVGGSGGNDPAAESLPYSTTGITGKRNLMSGGVGYFASGTTAGTYTANATDNPGSQDNGYYVASGTSSSSPNTNAIQYILRLNGKTIWNDVVPPPSEFIPGAYQGTSSPISVNPGWPAYWHPWPTFYWNAFNLVNTPNLNLNGGNGAPQSDPEDGDAGPSGGGGGASAVIINGIPKVVAAGGGGGGGYGEDGAGGATPGLPGGRWVPTTTSIYPVTLSRAWNAFMNNYAIWGGGQDYTTTINFPSTGTYTFNYSVDNYGSVYLDGSQIITYSDFGTTTTYTQVVSAGNHTVRVTGVNTGGPAGVAAQILKPDGSKLWDTRDLILTSGLNSSSRGANGLTQGGGGSGGGGAGYPYGGLSGIAYGDDQQGSGGGNGGQNYNGGYLTAVIAGEIVESIVDPGSEDGTPGGLTDELYPGGKRGYPGTSGAVILIFTREFTGWIKESDSWKRITDAYVKTSEPTPGTAIGSQSFNTLGSNVFKVPAGVTLLTVSYPTGSGIESKSLSVTPGQNLNIELGDYGVPSQVGTLTIPAYSKKVFDYKGNVDHLTSMDIQVVAATAIILTTSGNNSTQQAAASANGLTLSYTYEGWHGDLTSTIVMTPAATNTVLNSVRVLAGGGGRAQGPAVTAQPTSPSYIMSGQIYDTSGGEGYYDINFTLEQRGYVTVSYDQPVMVSGWKRIIKGWIKDSNQWKAISAGGSIVSDLVSSSPGGVEAGPTINLALYSEILNYNLYGEASIRGYVPGKTTVNLNIDANVKIGSDSTSVPALLVAGFRSGDRINITNYGVIAGAGGIGGTGLSNGQDGGIGLQTDYRITIDNRGTIQGGGGGGAGVVRYGLATATSKHPTATYAGGGGAGLRAGTSGSPGRDTEGISTGSALTGNLVVGGSGTFGNNSGGNPGVAGNVYADYGSSLGGAAGAAVYGNTYVTWSNVGTIKGSRV